ncbi:T9SS type A sorting domain-containing protein [Aquimarina litoralis]|uniref:T9SS type A sorting domain-containing protein n=1 Tax=Aquimarina litoralis TaxID=584605 RepID=UPI001C568039|nr:T9SS type A sorting domain-containing protein [Aquimarina litoralis]MBW1296195.1 T9SS type A sorting domain-containing protein [Aquimarina litoralis]
MVVKLPLTILRIYLFLFFSISFLQAQDVVTLLTADGPGDTYQLIENTFGGTPYEVPDCDHNPPVAHINEVFDNDLNKDVFKFDIHRDIDTDRCRINIDRQRNEIKTYDPSPNKLKAVKEELVVYNWKFKLDSDFLPTNRFTHIFQIKAKGGNDDSNPVLTISPFKSSSSSAVRKLRVRYSQGDHPPSGPEYVTVREIDLAPFLGNWVEATCEVYVNEDSTTIPSDEKPGSIKLVIKDVFTGNELLNYEDLDIDMLREGSAVFLRPKWGIYRSLESSMPLRDETVYFADFSITEKDQLLLSTDEFDENAFGFYPNPVSNKIYFQNVQSKVRFELYNLQGKLIITATANEIDVHNLNAGIYILKTTNGNRNGIYKVLKQ